MILGEALVPAPGSEPARRKVATHERRVATNNRRDAEEGRLFFDEARVPVEVTEIPSPEAEGLDEDAYEVIGEKFTHRLARRPGSYVILKYVSQVIKRKDAQSLHCPPIPAAVLEGGRADVSFFAGLFVDTFLYHMPLYRQHQRLVAAGIDVSRQWLTEQVLAVALLLAPIVESQLAAIRACRVEAMDETPIKVGRKGRGKLTSGYFWPVWGNTDEGGGDIVFFYRPSRVAIHVREGLGEKVDNNTVLVTDGYAAYARYAERAGVTHAQCWAHTRRTLERAKDIEPEAAAEALARIGELYACEVQIREQNLTGEARRDYRLTHAKLVLDAFFDWAEEQLQHAALLPSNPLTKALHYALERRDGLSVHVLNPPGAESALRRQPSALQFAQPARLINHVA